MIQQKQLQHLRIPQTIQNKILELYKQFKDNPQTCWQRISSLCFKPRIPFPAFKYLYETIYYDQADPHPVWFPNEVTLKNSNLAKALKELNFTNYQNLFCWSVTEREAYWQYAINKLAIKFKQPFTSIVDLSQGVENPQWLPGAKLNIIDSCFQSDNNKTAIIYINAEGNMHKLSYAELEAYVNGIANAIHAQFKLGDVIAIDMPMNIEAVAIYLGIIKAGCVVAAIADSFAPEEIAIRLRITNAKAIFTQDYYYRANKKISLYPKVIAANAPKTIVITADNNSETSNQLRAEDQLFSDFISKNTIFDSISCEANSYANVLFSSGTTGEPKAIPWTHITPIKAAADAYFHQDVMPEDIVAWPTNLGWMMGPWLVFSTLINGATMALFADAPTSASFGQFVETAKVTILGTVPSVVNIWQATACMETFNWNQIKCFSSTAECSNPENYLYLMWLGNNKPIIEYCGGTEIGGGYITGSLLQNATPSLFTTPTLGLDFISLDEHGLASNNGEAVLIPPSIGLSNELLNRDHYQVYYADMPTHNQQILRRHGDHIEKISDFCYRSHGRIDDTMNLSGIKTSSADIERVLNTLDEVKETAAIAVSGKSNGPSKLVIYATLVNPKDYNIAKLKVKLQKQIKDYLNPLFKIHDVIVIDALPRTASNKIMRRVLRDQYHQAQL